MFHAYDEVLMVEKTGTFCSMYEEPIESYILQFPLKIFPRAWGASQWQNTCLAVSMYKALGLILSSAKKKKFPEEIITDMDKYLYMKVGSCQCPIIKKTRNGLHTQ